MTELLGENMVKNEGGNTHDKIIGFSAASTECGSYTKLKCTYCS